MSILYDMRSGTLVKSKLYSNGLILKNLLGKDKAIKELFTGGKQGIWLDPSDLSTMFKDAAGNQPVTTDGDPVGLILDKSQGLGVNLWSDINVSIVNRSGTIGAYKDLRMTNTASSLAGYPRFSFNVGLEVGKRYYVKGVLKSNLNKPATIRLALSGSTAAVSFNTLTGEFIGCVVAESTVFQVATNLSIGEYLEISSIEIREAKGNHATQTLSAARPTYRTNGILHWLKFDGVDDYLKTNYTPTTAWSTSAAITVTFAKTSMVFEGYTAEGKSPNMYLQSDGRVTVWNVVSGAIKVTNPTSTLNTPNVHSITCSISNIATVPVTVGARLTETYNSFNFEGRVFGLVIVNGVEQMDEVHNSLKVKGGVI